MAKSKTKLVVAAIDFGTTYSGYAYAFRSDYARDPTQIKANMAWQADGEGLVTMKAPTIVLFDKDEHFHSFGFDAESHYIKLATEEKHKGWRYFRRFKMRLHDQKRIRRGLTITDDQGKPMLAMDVFAAAIRFLKGHLMKLIQNRVKGIVEYDVDWVLTVPAIWDENSKQFMIEAAEKAGIPGDQLTLALEPEAAAVYCKEIEVSVAKEMGKQAQLRSFDPGARFMVIDLGGGTVDITAHEVQTDGSLKGLIPPSGGPWGGTVVDAAYQRFLTELFTKRVLGEFGKDCKDDELHVHRTFELKKRSINDVLTEEDEKVYMKVPNVLFEIYQETTGNNFGIDLQGGKYASMVTKKRDKLIVQQTLFSEMFQEPKEKVIAHVRDMLRDPALRRVDTLMVVGGFSESDIIKNTIERAFPLKQVIRPMDAGLAIVKGAVMYGYNTQSISSRKSPYTYGISVAVPYDEKKHPAVHMSVRGMSVKCENIFKVFITAGSTLVPNKTCAEHSFNTPFGGSSMATVEIYRTKSNNPVYITDEGCSKVGVLELTIEDVQSNETKLIDVKMSVGSHLEVMATENGTRNKVSAQFNFLN